MDNTELSKEEKEMKERLLNEKMEAIKKKNEELKKRYEEIEADKKLADEHSASVHINEVKPYIMKPHRARPERVLSVTDQNTSNEEISVSQDLILSRQRLTNHDGPPPDPAYSFLADPDRDRITENDDDKDLEKENQGQRRVKGEFEERGRGRYDGRGRGGRYGDKRRGGGGYEGARGQGGGWQQRGKNRGGFGRSYGNNHSENDSSYRGKREFHRGKGQQRAYEQWKAERAAIDEARLSRARAGDGEWRREWDIEKQEQQENNEVGDLPAYDPRFPRNKEKLKLQDMISEKDMKKLEDPARESFRKENFLDNDKESFWDPVGDSSSSGNRRGRGRGNRRSKVLGRQKYSGGSRNFSSNTQSNWKENRHDGEL